VDFLSSLAVIQHTSAEYLGLMEDHFEGRKIRFSYHRPFTESGTIPRLKTMGDGLILLGGGPWGSAGPRNVPTLVKEVELTHACLEEGRPVIGIGLGAQILALAAGGKTFAAPLVFRVEHAHRVVDDALRGFLPERYVNIVYMRDRFEPPADATVLATDDAGAAALFQVGDKAFGFSGHPGFKAAIAEDLIMEFEEIPDDTGPMLAAARDAKQDVENALIPIMTGLVQATGLMDT
jgi:GMP synthase-like glutamine amidotransferase